MNLAPLKELVLDVVFPPTCIGCKRGGTWWCEDCRGKIVLYHHALCPKCGKRSHKDQVCSQTWSYNSLLAMSSYADPELRKVLTSYKYKRALCLLDEGLKPLMQAYKESFLDVWPWAGLSSLTVTSIPMDEKRKHARGLDHAWKIAELVQNEFVPWATLKPLLKRTKTVAPNASLPSDALRKANIHNVFEVIEPIHGPVLLVDDVLTTGATLSEAARTLEAAGATEVHIFVMAIGV